MNGSISTLASDAGRHFVLLASVHCNSDNGMEKKKMSKKKFRIDLTYTELYAIRNALYEMGNNDELLAKINEQIDMLHAYFDGRWHLPHGIKPDLSLWRCRK